MTKSKLIIKEKEVVVPGEVVAEGMDYLPGFGMYRQDKKVKASRLGLMRLEGKVIKLIPLSGKYLPKRGDVIIGRVQDINLSGWNIDTNSAYHAMLPLRDASTDYIKKGSDLTKYFAVGDYIVTKITNVTSQNLIDLSMKGPGLRKLEGGRIMRVAPSKVPRIIGSKGSMVSMIKKSTNCNIMVGQNGVVWVRGNNPSDETKAVKAIQMIEDKSHVSGLTDMVNKFLEGEQ